MTAPVPLRAAMTVRAALRRRLGIAILVAMPIAFYFVSHDSVGRAVRSLAFGLSWAVSTVAFFAATAAAEIEPRLAIAGWRRRRLVAGRLLGLATIGGLLTCGFAALVAVDLDVRSPAAVLVTFAVTAAVGVAVGTAVGGLLDREMEGTLVLFFIAGLQAVVNPFDTYARALPFWSSRELATHAVDGPDVGSLAAGLTHAGIVIGLAAVVVSVVTARGIAPRRHRAD